MKGKFRNDLLLLALLLGAGCVLFLLWGLQKDNGAQVIVRVDGQENVSFSLSDEREYNIQSAGGGVNLLRISGGAVWLEDANCPDRICVKQGKIRYAGDSIICLPHGVVVEISGDDSLTLDGVTG